VDPAFIGAVSVYVILEMLKKPSVFRYQGLPYAARIGALAGPFLNQEQSDVELVDSVSWDEIKRYLTVCPEILQVAIVCAFVHGDTDECISRAMGWTLEESASLRSKALEYLANADHAGGQGKSSEIVAVTGQIPVNVAKR
jgi:hypothetical protein